jgi:tripartite-type tricarboxylate transporter receptor subunit TctC
MRPARVLALLGVAAFCHLTVIAQAADWPTAKAVRIIAPSTPGGAADMFGRMLADNLPAILGGRYYVENRNGGAGLVASAAAARAEPDGYTLVISGMAYQVVGPAANPNAGFDPMKDFTHIAYIGGPPTVFVVNPASGIHSLDALVERARHERTDYVAPGVGTISQMMMVYFAQKAGLKLQQIMTSGASQALLDVVAGNVNVGTMTWTTALPQIRAGKVIPLAVTSAARPADAPEVPTFKELGYDDLTTSAWFSLSGPAGLPNDITQKLNRAVIKVLDLPDVRSRLDRDSIETRAMTPEQFTAFMVSEIAKWGPIAKTVGPGN